MLAKFGVGSRQVKPVVMVQVPRSLHSIFRAACTLTSVQPASAQGGGHSRFPGADLYLLELHTWAAALLGIGLSCWRDKTHGALGQRSNGQAGIDTEVGRHHRSVTDVHIPVAKDAVVIINHPVRGRIGDHTTSDTVRCARNIEENLRKHAHGKTTGELRNFLRKLVCLRNVGGHLLAPADEKPPERPEPEALPAHLDLAFQRLHAEENHKLLRPAYRLQDTNSLERMA